MPFRYCPDCGVAAEAGGRFCSGCGRSLRESTRGLPLAGVVALVCLLVLGAGFWLQLRLAPEAPRPPKPGEGRAPAGGAASAPAPRQVELPDDIKQYIAGLVREADAKPQDAAAWETLARVSYRASRIDPSYAEQAERAFAHLVEIDPKSLEGLRGLANLAYDREDRARAIEYYRRYLALMPDDPEVRTDLGTMLFESGKPDEAIAEYDRVIAKSPSFFQAHFNLAVVYDSKGDRAQARSRMEKARELAPDDAVKQRIAALLEAAVDGRTFAQAAQAVAAQGGPPGAGSQAGAGAAAPPLAGAAPAATPAATSFAAAVEQVFRGNPVAGPKVVRVEWPTPEAARVIMAGFPMEAMPEGMRDGYVEKMRKGIDEARQRFGVSGPVTVELVDHVSGKVMATVRP